MTTAASGGDLPPEIINHIVQSFGDDGVHKRGLSTCSLTCRYWAQSIIPILFDHLTLRSAEDVAQLKAFLDAPRRLGISLAEHIHGLAVECSGPQSRPWLHHLWDISKRISGAHLFHYIHIDNVSLATVKRELSFHQPTCGSFCLPRSLPLVCYSPIRELHISNLVFNSRADLFKLTDSLPALWQYTCVNITFRRPAFVSYRRPLPLRSKDFRWVQVAECEDGSLQAQMALATALLEPHRRIHLAADIWQILSKSASVLTPLTYRSASTSCDGRNDTRLVNRSGSFGPSYDLSIYLDVKRTERSTLLRLDFVVDALDPQAEHHHVRSVTVTFWGENPEHAPHEESSYSAFEDALHELDEVPQVSINFRENVNAFRWLLVAVIERTVFNRLRQAHKLNLTFGYEEVSLGDILASPSEYSIDDSMVTLSTHECFDYLRCKTQDERDELLRAALARSQVSIDGETATA